MPGLVPGIHVFTATAGKQDVDGRDKPGHDEGKAMHVAFLFITTALTHRSFTIPN